MLSTDQIIQLLNQPASLEDGFEALQTAVYSVFHAPYVTKTDQTALHGVLQRLENKVAKARAKERSATLLMQAQPTE